MKKKKTLSDRVLIGNLDCTHVAQLGLQTARARDNGAVCFLCLSSLSLGLDLCFFFFLASFSFTRIHLPVLASFPPPETPSKPGLSEIVIPILLLIPGAGEASLAQQHVKRLADILELGAQW